MKCIGLIYFFVSRQKADKPTPKHRRWLTTWQVICQVERRFHSRELNRQPRPRDSGISPPSSNSLVGLIRAGSYGPVPSPTHISKSPHGGQSVPTFEHDETFKVWFLSMRVGSWLCYANKLTWLMLRVRSSLLLDPTVDISPKPHLQNVLPCKYSILVSKPRTWDPMWSGKSHLPCSQRLSLRTWTDLK